MGERMTCPAGSDLPEASDSIWVSVAAVDPRGAGAAACGRCSTCTWVTGACAAIPGCSVMPLGRRDRRMVSSPSRISISARLDSSNRSINFLILRKSMTMGLWSQSSNAGLDFVAFARRLEAVERSVQRELVAPGAEAGDHAQCQV